MMTIPGKINPALPLIKEIVHTTDINHAAELVQSGRWIIVWMGSTAENGQSIWHFDLGRTL